MSERIGDRTSVSRREFVKGAGALVVAFSFTGVLPLPRRGIASSRLASAPPVAGQLDSWLAVGADGGVTVFSGKVELGTGVSTALRQIVAEELDVPLDRIAWVQGDTDRTVDQGPTVGSQSVKRGGAQLRRAAAEARSALLEMASAELGAPVDRLVVRDGVIAVSGDESKTRTFAQLVGGKRFEREVTDRTKPKSPRDYTIVGKPARRVEIPAKMTGKHVYVHDVRVPGMAHGRVVRPSGPGATLVDVDESSVRQIPGVIRVVRKGDFVGVVAEREEQAVRAAKELKVTWRPGPALPAMSDLHDVLRASPAAERVLVNNGDFDAAMKGAAKTLKATYRWPFQMHASIGPSCGVADVRGGKATIWSGTQGAHTLRAPIAQLLGLTTDDVHVIWTEASGCYGHNGADDAAADAALLSQAVGRPVRVQWMRQDEHGWEPKGCPMVIDMAGGLDAQGRVVAWDYHLWSPSHTSRPSAQSAATLLAGKLAGAPAAQGRWGGGDRNARHTYVFAQSRVTAHQLEGAPLRTSSFRGLGSPQNSFANESFVDELAAAAGADPVEFRLRHLADPRAIAVIQAAAKRAGWESRPARHARSEASGEAVGRGFAYVQYDTTEAYVATAVDLTVNRSTGRIRVTRVCVAHDCGLIINPDGLRNQIEGNVVQALSRTLKEEVKFDATRVTSVNWVSYPILTFPELPDAIDIDLIDHPDQPAVGAGEAATSPIPAAVANALFDATGVRVRTVPLTPERVKAALSS